MTLWGPYGGRGILPVSAENLDILLGPLAEAQIPTKTYPVY